MNTTPTLSRRRRTSRRSLSVRALALTAIALGAIATGCIHNYDPRDEGSSPDGHAAYAMAAPSSR